MRSRAATTRIVERPDLAARDPKEIFARLFDEYARPLRGYLAGRVGAHVADDLVAETGELRPAAGCTGSPPTCCATTCARRSAASR
jgi:hypothetical protein